MKKIISLSLSLTFTKFSWNSYMHSLVVVVRVKLILFCCCCFFMFSVWYQTASNSPSWSQQQQQEKTRKSFIFFLLKIIIFISEILPEKIFIIMLCERNMLRFVFNFLYTLKVVARWNTSDQIDQLFC